MLVVTIVKLHEKVLLALKLAPLIVTLVLAVVVALCGDTVMPPETS